MTQSEKNIAAALANIKPNDFKEGKFIDQLPSWHGRDMTEKGRDYMLRLLDRHSEFIPEHQELKDAHVDEQLEGL